MSSMAKVSFKTDWVDAEGISGPELSATWASLEIRAGDSIITRVLDTRAKTVRDFVYVPLYPFAEWVATNWWFLTREIGNPTKDADPQFRHRHAIGGNREGYAYPDLEVLPYGTLTCLGWTPGPSPWTGIEFLDWGELWVDSSEFRDTCTDLIDRVIRRLLSLGVEGTLLQEEWEAIQAADRDEIEFCEAAAGLGWDPYDLGDDERSLVSELGRTLSGAVLEEGIAAFDARSLMTECSAIAGAIGRAKANALRWEPVASIDHELALAAPTPWEAGYELARDVRRALGLDGQPLPSMARIAAAIDAEPALLDELTAPVDFEAAALVDGVITRNDDRFPAFAFREFSSDESRRFHFCRALGEMYASPGTDTLLTRAHSERQQRNRAFAAEFLAPSSSLRQSVSRPFLDRDEVDELAAAFGVSSWVIAHQIRNHRIAEVWDSESPPGRMLGAPYADRQWGLSKSRDRARADGPTQQSGWRHRRVSRSRWADEGWRGQDAPRLAESDGSRLDLPQEPGLGLRAGSVLRLAADADGLAQLSEHAAVRAQSYVTRFPEAVPAGAGALRDALLAMVRSQQSAAVAGAISSRLAIDAGRVQKMACEVALV